MYFNYLFLDGSSVDVSYFLIMQDIVGILVAMLGLKLSIIYLLYIIRQGEKLKNALCLIGSAMLMFSGINLVFFNVNLSTWFISMVLIIIASFLGKLAYRKL